MNKSPMNDSPMNHVSKDIQVTRENELCRVLFPAMASDCEVLIDTQDLALAWRLGSLAQQEALRIEWKFSRYRDDNPVYRINHSGGNKIEVDDETAALLDFSATLWQLSDGRFDITSGVLRKVWRFDGSDRVPTPEAVKALMSRIGWQKVSWDKPCLSLPEGMEIDFGGIGKEYAVDKVFGILAAAWGGAFLVNFGGDIRAKGPRNNQQNWQVGIEQVTEAETPWVELANSALATSGDSRRYLLKDGIRYCHILDPQTGWPVKNTPRSVTTIAPTCVEAGMHSSLAMLMGTEAEEYLQEQSVPHFVLR